MGLDIYVGPLTRYYAGAWKTVVQQAGEQMGMEVQIIRANPDPDDAINDPVIIEGMIKSWQAGLAQALELPLQWADTVDLPYWTDKPDWDGFGAVVLLAAYEVCPEKKPSGGGMFWNKNRADNPSEFNKSAAYTAAVQLEQSDYASLLSDVEWWLPLEQGPSVFGCPDPAGNPRRMSRIQLLHDELVQLNEKTLKMTADDLAAARKAGPPKSGSAVEPVARFGLSCLLPLVREAMTNRQPLLMDY